MERNRTRQLLSDPLVTVTEQLQSRQETKSKVLVLKLREVRKSKITWAEDTVDNEHLGKKSSKS